MLCYDLIWKWFCSGVWLWFGSGFEIWPVRVWLISDCLGPVCNVGRLVWIFRLGDYGFVFCLWVVDCLGCIFVLFVDFGIVVVDCGFVNGLCLLVSGKRNWYVFWTVVTDWFRKNVAGNFLINFRSLWCWRLGFFLRLLWFFLWWFASVLNA